MNPVCYVVIHIVSYHLDMACQGDINLDVCSIHVVLARLCHTRGGTLAILSKLSHYSDGSLLLG